MLSNYELKDAEFLIILLAVLCNWCLTFLIKKNMCLITKLITLLKARIEAKNNTIHRVLEFNRSQCVRPYMEFKR